MSGPEVGHAPAGGSPSAGVFCHHRAGAPRTNAAGAFGVIGESMIGGRDTAVFRSRNRYWPEGNNHSQVERLVVPTYCPHGRTPASMPTSNAVPCEHCGAQAAFSTEISPLGSEPGHRVYQCPDCKRHTWVAWQMMPQHAPQRQQPVQQQQQQQQAQPKKDEPKE
jgi:hypothetical protein